MRGLDVVQIPTTLLAQVDSSVGGKTAIDTPEGKNLVGLFHQPRLVIADTDVLTTLPQRELRAGYAEVVKCGLISDAHFFQWCEANAGHMLGTAPAPFDPGGHYDGIMAVNEIMRTQRAEALTRAVRVAVAFKARIVEADETEQGQRALLNLGHTFAHALEGHAGYDGKLLHGEAVGVGMRLAFTLSSELGYCAGDDARRVRAHLERAGFVTDLRQLPGAPYDPDRLMDLMAADKKAEAGKLTLILARAIGRAFIERDAPADVVRELLQYETRK
jgi:3-dehydroquinate synthetase